MKFRFLIYILILIQTGCSPYKFFYYPNKKLYIEPNTLNISYEMITYPSLNGKKLFGLLFKTDLPPKGIVVHFHGNFGNVSNHFLQSYYLTKYGFDVFIFDYQGYGGSEGSPSPKKTIEDGISTVRFADALNRNPEGGVVLLGQSLGGAVAIPTMAKEPLARAAVIEASFPSYRKIARDVLKRSFLTWILYPIYPFFISKKYDPTRYIDEIAGRPLFFVHGKKDGIVPSTMSEILYEKASEPKSIWFIEEAGHLGGRRMEAENYEERIATFFTNALEE